MTERTEEAKKKTAEEEKVYNKPSSQNRNSQLTVFRPGVAKYVNMEASQQ
jgi:hypothetical protein